MVVGDAAALKSLGQQLILASESNADSGSDKQWPVLVASPEVLGPYQDVRGFSLSFHLGNASWCQKSLPASRRSIPAALLVPLTVFSVIGLISVSRWVLEKAF